MLWGLCPILCSAMYSGKSWKLYRESSQKLNLNSHIHSKSIATMNGERKTNTSRVLRIQNPRGVKRRYPLLSRILRIGHAQVLLVFIDTQLKVILFSKQDTAPHCIYIHAYACLSECAFNGFVWYTTYNREQTPLPKLNMEYTIYGAETRGMETFEDIQEVWGCGWSVVLSAILIFS